MATLETGKIGFILPLDLMDQTSQPEPGPTFVYPSQRTQLLEFQSCFQDMYSHKIHEFVDELDKTADLLNTLKHEWDSPADLTEHNIFHNSRVAAAAAAGISKQKIQALDAQLQQLLEPALTLAMQKLTTVKAKPEKHYLCRADKKRLMELIEKGKRARSAYEEGLKDPVLQRELHSELDILRRERHALTYSIRLANAKQRITEFQDLVSSKPNFAHKFINGKLKDRVDPQVPRQQVSNVLLFKSKDVLQEFVTESGSKLTDPASPCEKAGSCGWWSKVAVSVPVEASACPRFCDG